MKATCIVKDMPRCSNNTNIFQADLPSWRSSFSCQLTIRFDISSQFVSSSIRWMFSIDLGHQIRTGYIREVSQIGSLQTNPQVNQELGDTWKHRWNLSCDDFLRCYGSGGFFCLHKVEMVFFLNRRNSWYNWPDLHHIFISWANQVTHLGDQVTKAGWWFHPLNGPPWTPDENGSIRPNW